MPFTFIARVSLSNVTVPVLKIAVLLAVAPGARVAPEFTVTGPVIVPLPPRTVPELFTITLPLPLPEPLVLLMSNVPALTVVPLNVKVPPPDFVKSAPPIVDAIWVEPVAVVITPPAPRTSDPLVNVYPPVWKSSVLILIPDDTVIVPAVPPKIAVSGTMLIQMTSTEPPLDQFAVVKSQTPVPPLPVGARAVPPCVLNGSHASGDCAKASFVRTQKTSATTAEKNEILWKAMKLTERAGAARGAVRSTAYLSSR